jgi:hypothetical protein
MHSCHLTVDDEDKKIRNIDCYDNIYPCQS